MNKTFCGHRFCCCNGCIETVKMDSTLDLVSCGIISYNNEAEWYVHELTSIHPESMAMQKMRALP
jgi:hypothetical protein